MAVQRAQRHAVTPAELTSSHPARPIQTCQPLYLRSATTTNHCAKLSAHKQSPSQILSRKKGAFLRRIRPFRLSCAFLSRHAIVNKLLIAGGYVLLVKEFLQVTEQNLHGQPVFYR